MRKRARAGGTRPQPYNRVRASYTEQERIATVAILLDHGGLTKEGIKLAQEYLGNGSVSLATLKKWRDRYSDKVRAIVAKPETDLQTALVINDAQRSALEIMQSIRDKLLKAVEEVVDENPTALIKIEGLRNSTVSIGVLEDKIRSASGLSASMQQKIKHLASLCLQIETDIESFIDDCIIAVQQQIENNKAKKRDNDSVNGMIIGA